jgi:dihydrofolate reductase
MRELTADLFVSLDGFAAGVDEGPYFGYSGPELASWVRNALDQPQVILMGRHTYEALMGITASAADDASARMHDLPKLVCSRMLAEPLTWRNTRLIKGDIAHEIAALKRQPGDPLRSIGNLTLVQSLVHRGLVDRLRLMIFPLILGTSGRESIYATYRRTGLELIETTVLDARLVLLEYQPMRSTAG